jgi:hypothetical protein
MLQHSLEGDGSNVVVPFFTLFCWNATKKATIVLLSSPSSFSFLQHSVEGDALFFFFFGALCNTFCAPFLFFLLWFYCIEEEEDNSFHHLLQWLCRKEMVTFAFFWWFYYEEGDGSNVVTFLYGGDCILFLFVVTYGLVH